MKNIIKQLVPKPMRPIARIIYNFIKKWVYYSLLDTIDLLLGRRDELSPPKRKIFVGNGDFKIIGEEFLGYFKHLTDLKPNESVLDVGCGIGRMAVPLTRYLGKGGSYYGFDIVAEGIKWSKK